MVDEIIDAECLRREIGGVLALVGDLDARAGLQQIDHEEAEQQRDDRGRDEPAHRLCANPPDRRCVAHMPDADDEGGQHQGTDDHLDQFKENRADQRHVLGDFHRRRLVGKRIIAHRAQRDAEHQANHHVNEISVHCGPLPSLRAAQSRDAARAQGYGIKSRKSKKVKASAMAESISRSERYDEPLRVSWSS